MAYSDVPSRSSDAGPDRPLPPFGYPDLCNGDLCDECEPYGCPWPPEPVGDYGRDESEDCDGD